MSTGVIVTIIVVILIVIVVAAIAMAAARRRRLKERFGPEYDRMVAEQQSQRRAEAELAGRERRVRNLDIKQLSPEARTNYMAQWSGIQERFVDQPTAAVGQAQELVTSVMQDRGYPTEEFDQITADLSVEHAQTLEHYRAAHSISESAANGSASTEDLRQAMIHYRAMFGDLLGDSSSEATDQELPGTSAASNPNSASNGTGGTLPTADSTVTDTTVTDTAASSRSAADPASPRRR
jgi:Tfp pilus assembly protein PilX